MFVRVWKSVLTCDDLHEPTMSTNKSWLPDKVHISLQQSVSANSNVIFKISCCFYLFLLYYPFNAALEMNCFRGNFFLL